MIKKLLCRLIGHQWIWQLDTNLTSWVRCSRCKKSLFGDEVGVILINWKKTDENYNLQDVLLSNLNNKGIVLKLKSARKRFPSYFKRQTGKIDLEAMNKNLKTMKFNQPKAKAKNRKRRMYES